MSFKISNVIVDEANREALLALDSVENVSSATTLDPHIAITKVTIVDSDYTLILPNGYVGEQKFITVVSGSGHNVAISYNNGWGSENTTTLSITGDSVLFVATANGWHYRSWID